MTHTMRATGAGAATSEQATKDEATELAGTGGFEVQESATDTEDSADRQAQEQHEKAVATMQARFALAGWALALGVAPESFLAIRWGQTRELRGLADAEAFLGRVTGSTA